MGLWGKFLKFLNPNKQKQNCAKKIHIALLQCNSSKNHQNKMVTRLFQNPNQIVFHKKYVATGFLVLEDGLLQHIVVRKLSDVV